MQYSVRYVHKVASRDDGEGPGAFLDLSRLGITPAFAAADRRELGKLLRDMRLLSRGARVRDWRREPGGRIVVFPTGLASGWHSIILTPVKTR